MIQYSLLGRTAVSTRLNTTFRGLAPSPSSAKTDLLRMGTELVPKTLYSIKLTRLCAQEDYIERSNYVNHISEGVIEGQVRTYLSVNRKKVSHIEIEFTEMCCVIFVEVLK
jgi:hypothetical protein